ncbi:MAG TPA: laminin B domain-containing protein [Gemmatimonadales bacterium]|nr:laminin B domain-containing protein [Gemmatimonadales bacterium]
MLAIRRGSSLVTAILVTTFAAAGCGKDGDGFGPPGNQPPPNIPTFPVVSTFDANHEQWRIVGDAQDGRGVPFYDAQGGNPGGRIYAVDDVLGRAWFFRAPARFLGNAAAAYGKVLRFDLMTSDTAQAAPKPDAVMLVGTHKTLVINDPPTPGLSWTRYSFRLDETGGWIVRETGAPATKADFDQALANLTDLYIRGEFRPELDIGWLDNVYFGADN